MLAIRLVLVLFFSLATPLGSAQEASDPENGPAPASGDDGGDAAPSEASSETPPAGPSEPGPDEAPCYGDPLIVWYDDQAGGADIIWIHTGVETCSSGGVVFTGGIPIPVSTSILDGVCPSPPCPGLNP